ncbi:MAG: hypothetical protein Q4B28_01105 [bacterium]|nr:hypothetical protein [bacterium]
MTNEAQLLSKGRKYGRDIPHLVEPEEYGILYDPEAIEDMEMMARGEYIESTPEELKAEKIRLQAIFQPEERGQVSLRLYKSDIEKLKLMAKEEGMPYQTLMTSILHKVANKKLITTLQ